MMAYMIQVCGGDSVCSGSDGVVVVLRVMVAVNFLCFC